MRLNIFLIFLLLSFSLFATTHTVCQDGQGDFTVIQDAINASAHGDTVLVHPGRYFENLVTQGHNITLASLNLTAGDYSYVYSTIIDGNQSGTCIEISGDEDGFAVQGFTITNGSGTLGIYNNGGGIYIGGYNQNTSIINCRIIHNSADGGGGIMTWGETIFLSGVSIHDNISIAGGGILASRHNITTFDPVNRCSIYRNYSGNGQDFYIPDSYSTMNVIVDTFSVFEPTGYFAVGTKFGNWVGPIYSFDIQHGYYTPVEQDLYVAPDGDNNNSGLTPYEPLQTVAYAMHLIASDSLSWHTVHCAPGIYTASQHNQFFPVSAKRFVTLTGDPNSGTIFDGDGNDRILLIIPAQNTPVTVRNFTLRNNFSSNANINASLIIPVRSRNPGPILFENMLLSDSQTAGRTGVFVIGVENEVIFRNVTFRNLICTEETAGVESIDSFNLTFENCLFENLHTDGHNYQPEIQGFGAIKVTYAYNINIDNCAFINCNSSAQQGSSAIGLNPMSHLIAPDYRINNCLFYNNSSSGQSNTVSLLGIHGGSGSITNCTFIDNDDSDILRLLGNVDITNSILRNNNPYEITLPWPSGMTPPTTTINIDYCNIDGGQAAINNEVSGVYTVNYGTHNIDVDPQFVGSGQYPCSLQPGSPCIDAGDPATTLPWDIVYNERVWDGDNDGTAVADIGAYEYQPIFPAVNLTAQVSFTDVQLNWDELQTFNR
ncbi:MAG: right-handed parallel beta-helix repeat-containing protein, partial [Candidatus Cloacimonetes bacterium]|nr:right-handed parallel beta-helix repeat-containing protein [Candidatus Cloacimonadota bacterium]